MIGRGDYHWQHEPCWYAVRTKGNWTGDRKQTTLWTIPSGGQDTETVHGTQKPVECMRRPMLNNTSPGEAIYEPFLGSGTTLIAAETSAGSCFAIELDPLYVDVAIRRWQAFTGEQATLLADGRTFEAVAAERGERSEAVASSARIQRPSAPMARRHVHDAECPRPHQRSGELTRRTAMRGRRPKPTRLKMLTGNPGKRPLNHDEPRPEAAIPECPPELGPVARAGMGPARRRTRRTAPAHQPRSRRPCRLLRRLRALGRGHRGDPEIRRHGQVADRISDPVALPRRSPTGRPRS